ncbi:MAG: 4Fe-4S dicluster domain-containing protein [Deltaproteobacteria bacterium]|jgi:Pyruvate/2-oxoacid:ferredoxin oxidoreductase delta subunit|nr:4Fe-4S dicluster domain-containing protein [Deltaproteobacteria bacterium]
MEQDNQVYTRLQRHLDRQAVGFPATRSGVEIKLLKHIFTPEEAGIACCLSHKYEPLETIFHRAGHLVASAGELEQRLEGIQKQGLVLQPSNTAKAAFICSCCGCCCGMLGIHQDLPKPLEFWVANFYAAVDSATCEGCGACVKRCQVAAVSVAAKKQPAVVDRNRCIGCGVCVPACPTASINLVKKPAEVRPPQTREDLHDIMMAGKKGRLAKLKLAGKLIVDSVRTGHMNLFKY